jgi:predicted transposase YbfD/YdcC
MAKAIRERGGQYVLALKGNRGPLYHETVSLLDNVAADAIDGPQHDHGRIETRQAAILAVPAGWDKKFKFHDLAAVARIDAVRRLGPSEERQSRYFVLSRMLSAADVLATVRAHWGIENRQHWVLDVVLHEDRARSRKDNAAQNLALLRRLALNLLRSDGLKASIRRKIKRAGWVEDYLFTLLAQMR